jgi:hypothetical protein
MIICGFAGIGKSTMARENAGVVDLESTPFQKDWSTYARVARHMRDSGYIVLVSCHKELRTHLYNNGIKYYVVLPNPENKEAFIQRYINRGNSEDFIRMLDENWESFCEELPWEIAIRVGEDYISEALPTIDAVPVVYGRWEEYADEYGICATEFTCSVCKESYCTGELTDEQFREMMKYCPNCGTLMIEEARIRNIARKTNKSLEVSGKSDKVESENSKLKVNSKQFGKKLGKHAVD